MAPNVVDPSILAIGGSDGQIRIWKTLSSKSAYDYNTIYQKLSRSEISALAWDPKKESKLFYTYRTSGNFKHFSKPLSTDTDYQLSGGGRGGSTFFSIGVLV